MLKQRLDQAMAARGLVATRSQAESFIKLGEVSVDGEVITKPGYFVSEESIIKLAAAEQYVSRAALKLASVVDAFKLDFTDKVVLDVGSSTGGFTDYALKHGAKKVIAVEVGKDQMHPSLRSNPRVELYEQTDIRRIMLENKARRTEPSKVEPWNGEKDGVVYISEQPDFVVADVSFISLREILPHISKLVSRDSQLVIMVKPQFEASHSKLKHKGVIKNDRMRREILKDFESWAAQYFVILDKADSQIAGAKGNLERFYKLKIKS
jgi:23S rRNA (cytidine1920-2'-O)/16S rRNA (cytidine1409-2'-O)-methyltransferase